MPIQEQDAVQFVELSGQILERSMKIAESAVSEKTAAAEQAPRTLDKLIEAGLVSEDMRKFGEENLSDHAKTLQVLYNVTSHYQKMAAAATKEAAAAVGNGRASEPHDPPPLREKSAVIGARRGVGDPVRESDLSLLRLAGRR